MLSFTLNMFIFHYSICFSKYIITLSLYFSLFHYIPYLPPKCITWKIYMLVILSKRFIMKINFQGPPGSFGS